LITRFKQRRMGRNQRGLGPGGRGGGRSPQTPVAVCIKGGGSLEGKESVNGEVQGILEQEQSEREGIKKKGGVRRGNIQKGENLQTSIYKQNQMGRMEIKGESDEEDDNLVFILQSSWVTNIKGRGEAVGKGRREGSGGKLLPRYPNRVRMSLRERFGLFQFRRECLKRLRRRKGKKGKRRGSKAADAGKTLSAPSRTVKSPMASLATPTKRDPKKGSKKLWALQYHHSGAGGPQSPGRATHRAGVVLGGER